VSSETAYVVNCCHGYEVNMSAAYVDAARISSDWEMNSHFLCRTSLRLLSLSPRLSHRCRVLQRWPQHYTIYTVICLSVIVAVWC